MSRFYRSVILLCLLFCMSFAVAASKTRQLQTIDGAYAFPVLNTKRTYIVRVSINPKSLAVKNKSLSATMKKIIAIACVSGQCKFLKARAGLGFYEGTFKVTHKEKKQHKINALIVACSYLGCTKDKVNIRKNY